MTSISLTLQQNYRVTVVFFLIIDLAFWFIFTVKYIPISIHCPLFPEREKELNKHFIITSNLCQLLY